MTPRNPKAIQGSDNNKIGPKKDVFFFCERCPKKMFPDIRMLNREAFNRNVMYNVASFCKSKVNFVKSFVIPTAFMFVES